MIVAAAAAAVELFISAASLCQMAGVPSADGTSWQSVRFCVAALPTVMAEVGRMATSWHCFEFEIVCQMAMAVNFLCQLFNLTSPHP
jgi:hypothetical protein